MPTIDSNLRITPFQVHAEIFGVRGDRLPANQHGEMKHLLALLKQGILTQAVSGKSLDLRGTLAPLQSCPILRDKIRTWISLQHGEHKLVVADRGVPYNLNPNFVAALSTYYNGERFKLFKMAKDTFRADVEAKLNEGKTSEQILEELMETRPFPFVIQRAKKQCDIVFRKSMMMNALRKFSQSLPEEFVKEFSYTMTIHPDEKVERFRRKVLKEATKK